LKKEEFEQEIKALILQPSQETTDALYEMALDALEDDGPQDIINAFDFISRHFAPSVLQKSYEIIQHGSAALPGELVAAAVFLQNGGTPEHMSQMASDGHLMCFYYPKEKGELSPLALCSVIEDGKTSEFYTLRFGEFLPFAVLSDAQKYANQQGISVTEAIQYAAMDGTIDPSLYEAQKVLVSRWPEMTKALSDTFEHCPAVAARIIFDADQDHVAVEYNPLWQELRKREFEKGIKTLPFHSMFGTYDLTLSVDRYSPKGRLAVSLQCLVDGYLEPYAMLTVNLPKQPVKAPNEAYIKTCDENEGLLEFVLKNHLGKLLPEIGHSGFCTYPKIAFDMDRLKEFDPEGTKRYLRYAQQQKTPRKRRQKGR